MKSFPKPKIIKNAEVDGIIFCSPAGNLGEQLTQPSQEKDQLQVLEQFWKNKGFQEGKTKGYEEGLKAGKEKGFQRGYEEGEKEGRKEGKKASLEEGLLKGEKQAKKEFGELIDLFRTLSQQATEQQEKFLNQFKTDIFTLCIHICEKVIRQELVYSHTLENIIKQMLTEAKSIITEESVELLLSQEDYDLLQDRQEFLKVAGVSIQELRLQAEPSIKRGDFRIVSSRGLINFEVSRLLNDLNKHVSETLFSPNEITD